MVLLVKLNHFRFTFSALRKLIVFGVNRCFEWSLVSKSWAASFERPSHLILLVCITVADSNLFQQIPVTLDFIYLIPKRLNCVETLKMEVVIGISLPHEFGCVTEFIFEYIILFLFVALKPSTLFPQKLPSSTWLIGSPHITSLPGGNDIFLHFIRLYMIFQLNL